MPICNVVSALSRLARAGFLFALAWTVGLLVSRVLSSPLLGLDAPLTLLRPRPMGIYGTRSTHCGIPTSQASLRAAAARYVTALGERCHKRLSSPIALTASAALGLWRRRPLRPPGTVSPGTVVPVANTTAGGGGDARAAARVLVTGAAGFIGMHASLALTEAGAAVVGLDNFNPYYSVDMKRARAAHLWERGGVEVTGGR